MINELLPDIERLLIEISNKLKNIKVEARGWSLAEKIGTLEAIHSTSRKVKKVKKGAEAAKAKLKNLAQSIEELAYVEA